MQCSFTHILLSVFIIQLRREHMSHRNTWRYHQEKVSVQGLSTLSQLSYSFSDIIPHQQNKCVCRQNTFALSQPQEQTEQTKQTFWTSQSLTTARKAPCCCTQLHLLHRPDKGRHQLKRWLNKTASLTPYP
jgi:hypothetical protein